MPPAFEVWNIIPRVGIEYIAPGQEPLKVSFGDTNEQVNALANTAKWIGDDTGQELSHPRLGRFRCYYKEGKVYQIVVLDDRFKTEERIGIGSSKFAVVEAYGEPDEIRDWKEFTLYFYERLNCVFGFPPNRTTVSFIAFE